MRTPPRFVARSRAARRRFAEALPAATSGAAREDHGGDACGRRLVWFGMVAGETCTTGQDHLRALVDQPRWRRRRSAGRWRPAPSALQSDRSERWVGSAISSAHQTFARCGDVLGTRWSTRQKPNPPSGYGRHRVTSSMLLVTRPPVGFDRLRGRDSTQKLRRLLSTAAQLHSPCHQYA